MSTLTSADKPISAFLHSWMDLVNLEVPKYNCNPVMVNGRKPTVRFDAPSGASVEIQFRSLRLARTFYKLIKKCRSYQCYGQVQLLRQSPVTVKFEVNLAR